MEAVEHMIVVMLLYLEGHVALQHLLKRLIMTSLLQLKYTGEVPDVDLVGQT